MYGKALAEFQTADPLVGRHNARVFALMEKKGETIKMLDRFGEQGRRGDPTSIFLSYIYSSLGKKQRALDWLQKAYAERDPGLVFIKVNPAFASLRSDPRFQDLMQRMHFPQ
jgi:hypothetical protein